MGACRPAHDPDYRCHSCDPHLDDRPCVALIPLYPFQVDGAAWLAPRQDALLADGVGLGKTRIAYAALPPHPAVIVVAPASVKGSWKHEGERVRPDLKFTVLTKRGSFRFPRLNEVIILNYELLPKPRDIPRDWHPPHPTGSSVERGDYPPMPGQSAFGTRVQPGSRPPSSLVLIADEVHYAKSRKAQRTKSLEALGRVVHELGGRRWGLTATPLLNDPTELRSVLMVLGLAAACGVQHFTSLKLMFSARVDRWGGHVWNRPSAQFLRWLDACMLRRTAKEVMPELPVASNQIHPVEIRAPVRRGLDRVLDELRAAGITLADIMGASERADRVVSRRGGLVFERFSAARAALALAKIPAMLEQVQLLQDAGEPVVVFSAHKAPIEALCALDGFKSIVGGIAPAKRTETVAAFQGGEYAGLGCTIQAGGVGITLTRACHAIMVDLCFTPALNLQAAGRLVRIGQTRPVVIHHLEVDHPLDKRVNEILEQKGALIDATLLG